MKYNEFEYLDKNLEVPRTLMKTAEAFSNLSKCQARKVCCMLYKDGNIISMGLNGTPSGLPNCSDLFKKENGVWKNVDGNVLEDQEAHHKWALIHEIHAEVNALAKAKCSVEGAVAVVTASPCFNCAKSLVAHGIKRIYYKDEYDDIDNVRLFLSECNVELLNIKDLK